MFATERKTVIDVMQPAAIDRVRFLSAITDATNGKLLMALAERGGEAVFSRVGTSSANG